MKLLKQYLSSRYIIIVVHVCRACHKIWCLETWPNSRIKIPSGKLNWKFCFQWFREGMQILKRNKSPLKMPYNKIEAPVPNKK